MVRCSVLGLFVSLMACTGSEDSASPQLRDAAQAFFDIQNDWDEETAAMLWPEWRMDFARVRHAWFAQQVGPCHSFAPMWVRSPTRARFVYHCERGEIEAYFQMKGSGRPKRFVNGLRGIQPPEEVTLMAQRVVSGEHDLGETDLELHRPCVIDRVHISSNTGALFVLACDHTTPTIVVALDADGNVKRFDLWDKPLDTWRHPNPEDLG